MELNSSHIGKKAALMSGDECLIGYVEERFMTPAHSGNKTAIVVNVPGRFPYTNELISELHFKVSIIMNDELIK